VVRSCSAGCGREQAQCARSSPDLSHCWPSSLAPAARLGEGREMLADGAVSGQTIYFPTPPSNSSIISRCWCLQIDKREQRSCGGRSPVITCKTGWLLFHIAEGGVSPVRWHPPGCTLPLRTLRDILSWRGHVTRGVRAAFWLAFPQLSLSPCAPTPGWNAATPPQHPHRLNEISRSFPRSLRMAQRVFSSNAIASHPARSPSLPASLYVPGCPQLGTVFRTGAISQGCVINVYRGPYKCL